MIGIIVSLLCFAVWIGIIMPLLLMLRRPINRLTSCKLLGHEGDGSAYCARCGFSFRYAWWGKWTQELEDRGIDAWGEWYARRRFPEKFTDKVPE